MSLKKIKLVLEFQAAVVCFFFFLIRFYLFIFREARERNINVWLPLACPLLGTWPETQACALTGNRTSDPLICRLALNH